MARAPPADSPVRPCDADLSCIAAPAVLESLDVLCGTSWLAANPPPTSTTAAAAAAIRGRRLRALGADSSGTTVAAGRVCSAASVLGAGLGTVVGSELGRGPLARSRKVV